MNNYRRATSEEVAFIKNNQSMRPRELAKYLGLHTTVVNYWLRAFKAKPRSRKLTNKSSERAKAYKVARLKHLGEKTACEICGNTESLSIHHIAGRSGKLLIDPNNFLVTCMSGSTYLNEKYPESNQTEGCHPWIERNLKLARELGYAKSKIRKQND